MKNTRWRLRASLAAAVTFLLSACPLPTPELPDGDNDGGAGTVAEGSTLFEAEEGSDAAYVFETNDTKYEGGNGWSFWTLSGETQEPFVGYSAALTKTSGNARAGYGIVFCHGETSGGLETMLVAMINNSGEYIVGEVTGAGFSVLVPWTTSARLKTGANQRNEVGVERTNGTFSLSLNGVVVESFEDEDEPLHSGGDCGFMVVLSPLDDFSGAPVRVRFEEL